MKIYQLPDGTYGSSPSNFILPGTKDATHKTFPGPIDNCIADINDDPILDTAKITAKQEAEISNLITAKEIPSKMSLHLPSLRYQKHFHNLKRTDFTNQFSQETG